MNAWRAITSRALTRAGAGLAACLLTLALAPPALAQRCQAPPGNSGIDEYCEQIPGAGGDRGPNDPGKGGSAILPATQRRLERAGAAGQAVLRLSDRTARSRHGAARRRSGADAEAHKGGTPLSAVRTAVESGPTVAPALWWGLLGIVLLFVTLAWLRYRRRPPGGV